jgi:CBS domain-containing protein
VLSVVARDRDACTVLVGDVMQSELVSVTGEESVADALHRMRQHGVRRMPVVSERGILQGIVTADDVLAIIAEELNDLVSTVHRDQHQAPQLQR